MAEALVAAVGLAVFGALWASTQEWFDFLPRRPERLFRLGCVGLLVLSLLWSPTAFRAGFGRFVAWRVAQAQKQAAEITQALLEHLVVTPSPEATPTPRRTRGG